MHVIVQVDSVQTMQQLQQSDGLAGRLFFPIAVDEQGGGVFWQASCSLTFLVEGLGFRV